MTSPAGAHVEEIDDALHVARSSNGADAAEAWRAVAALTPAHPAICEEVASRLRDLGHDGEADLVLREGVDRLPASMDLAVAFARSAASLGNAEEERRRWDDISVRFPDQVHGYLGGSRALRRLQRQLEAEAVLARGIERLGQDRRLLVDLAASVTSRNDWPAALRWWREVERQGWLNAEGYAGLGTAYLRAGDVEAARATLEKGLAAHVGSPDILMGLTELMTAQEDWVGAMGVWQDLVTRFPDNGRYMNGLGVAKWRLGTYQTERVDETHGTVHLERPVDVGRVEDASSRELFEAFESIGQDCEFGLVQRHFGAEPLGLLRWTTTKPDTLIAGLRTRFAGLGEFDNTVLDLGKPEIMVNDLALHIRFHTFIQQGVTLDLDKFRQKQARHLRYMKDIFLERLEGAERIYVYKYVGELDRLKVDMMFAELRRIGFASLVVVTRASEDHLAGTIEMLDDGLYLGRLSRYGLDNGLVWKIAFEEWTSICRNALRIITPGNETP